MERIVAWARTRGWAGTRSRQDHSNSWVPHRQPISSGEFIMPPTYDVHTHIGLDTGFYHRGWWPYAATARDLIEQMDRHGIDRAVCFPFTLPSAFDTQAFAERNEVTLLAGRFPFDRENALLANEIERVGGGRLLQFAMFDPA